MKLTHKEKAELRDYVKEQIKAVKEGSTTANIATYSTPKAFTGHSDDEGTNAIDISDDQYAYTIKAPKERKNSIKLHEESYPSFKQDTSRSNVQKINANILEVTKRIRELSQMLNHSIKLKTEQKLDNNIHWKRTNEALAKMHNRIASLSEKANQLYNLQEATAQRVKDELVTLLKQAGYTTIKPTDVDYNQAGQDFYEFDVMLNGEPYAIDYKSSLLTFQDYREEKPLGNIDQPELVIQNIKKEFPI